MTYGWTLWGALVAAQVAARNARINSTAWAVATSSP